MSEEIQIKWHDLLERQNQERIDLIRSYRHMTMKEAAKVLGVPYRQIYSLVAQYNIDWRGWYRDQAKYRNRPTCAKDGCDRVIDANNKSGFCRVHFHKEVSIGTCGIKGCDGRLGPSNKSGFCNEHRYHRRTENA